jgi:tetratricopeptide (TPR) repeat protein
MRTLISECPNKPDASAWRLIYQPQGASPRFLKLLLIFPTLLLITCSTATAQSSIDRVQRRTGLDSGTITATTPLGITLDKEGVASKIAAEEIEWIQFAGEPTALNTARSQFNRERYDDATETLKKISAASLTRPEVKQEFEFLTAATDAHLALAGKGDLKQSATTLGSFVSTNKTSFHIPAVLELLGDVYLAGGDEADARIKYETLAKAPAPHYKARSALLVGQLLLAQKKYDEAIPQFEASLAAAGTSPVNTDERRDATFGRAIALSGSKKLVEGTDAVKQLIARTQLDDTVTLAQGYNALGECYLAGGDNHSARDAFLHVDLLFPTAANEHAHSLYRLTEVWKDLRQPTRAQDAQQRLADEYPLSRWAGR